MRCSPSILITQRREGVSEDSVWHQCLGRDLQTNTLLSVLRYNNHPGGGAARPRATSASCRQGGFGEHTHGLLVCEWLALGIERQCMEYGMISIRRMDPGASVRGLYSVWERGLLLRIGLG